MKVFFDTNVYVAEALLGRGAQRMVEATCRARWRIFASMYLLDELAKVLVDYLGFAACACFRGQTRFRLTASGRHPFILAFADEGCRLDLALGRESTRLNQALTRVSDGSIGWPIPAPKSSAQ